MVLGFWHGSAQFRARADEVRGESLQFKRGELIKFRKRGGQKLLSKQCATSEKNFSGSRKFFCSHQSEKHRKLRVHSDPWKKTFWSPKSFFIVIQSVPCSGMPGCSRTSVFVLQWNHCLRTHCIKNLRGWIAGFNSVYQLIEIRTLGNPEILVNSSYSPFPGSATRF